MKLALLDFETTGLNPQSDHILEGAVSLVDGDTLEELETYSSLHDPGVAIPPDITEITGITDEMVTGHRLDDERFHQVCARADLLVAFYANFDRGFYEEFIDSEGHYRWACPHRFIDWQREGMRHRDLEYLAWKHRVITDPDVAHRAGMDVQMMRELLSRSGRRSGQPYLREMLDNAAAEWIVLQAHAAPFENKDLLRERGFAWTPSAKVWWKLLRADGLAEINEWLLPNVYAGNVGGFSRRRTFTVDPLLPDFEKAYGLK